MKPLYKNETFRNRFHGVEIWQGGYLPDCRTQLTTNHWPARPVALSIDCLTTPGDTNTNADTNTDKNTDTNTWCGLTAKRDWLRLTNNLSQQSMNCKIDHISKVSFQRVLETKTDGNKQFSVLQFCNGRNRWQIECIANAPRQSDKCWGNLREK